MFPRNEPLTCNFHFLDSTVLSGVHRARLRSSATQSTEQAKKEGPCSTLLDAAHSWVVHNTKTHPTSPNSHDTVVNAERNYNPAGCLDEALRRETTGTQHNHAAHRTWQSLGAHIRHACPGILLCRTALGDHSSMPSNREHVNFCETYLHACIRQSVRLKDCVSLRQVKNTR